MNYISLYYQNIRGIKGHSGEIQSKNKHQKVQLYGTK